MQARRLPASQPAPESLEFVSPDGVLHTLQTLRGKLVYSSHDHATGAGAPLRVVSALVVDPRRSAMAGPEVAYVRLPTSTAASLRVRTAALCSSLGVSYCEGRVVDGGQAAMLAAAAGGVAAAALAVAAAVPPATAQQVAVARALLSSMRLRWEQLSPAERAYYMEWGPVYGTGPPPAPASPPTPPTHPDARTTEGAGAKRTLDAETVQTITAEAVRRKTDGDSSADKKNEPRQGWMTGVVRMWREEEKYGFLTPDDGSADVYVHQSNLMGGNTLVEGGRLRFRVGVGARSGRELALEAVGDAVKFKDATVKAVRGYVPVHHSAADCYGPGRGRTPVTHTTHFH
eukprot:TRINITY_DN30718_c0_g1_i1.p1 TRINITY_DN30718_c0_g1~~TRINITY_DN30718_c0_g1_i1.p1  ORF type:complete len:344 (+),score=89.93 TRINITY_DN30718_c0_g1_i1:45-1076(+)